MKYDMVLLHAPSVYDFRGRDDVLFAYLNTSATVHVSSAFEMPPVGIISIKQHMEKCGLNVEYFNVASRMLKDPEFDVDDFFKRFDADYVGIDLHWLAHAHGAIELARLYKSYHPNTKVMIGGIASSYFFRDLMEYDCVDYVVRGYDTLYPIEKLVEAKNDPMKLKDVPNLCWKVGDETHFNDLAYTPKNYSAEIDWSKVFTPDRKGLTLHSELIPQAGCEYNCHWCAGSRSAFRRHMGTKKGVMPKTPEALVKELESLKNAQTKGRQTVVMIDFWHQRKDMFRPAQDVLDSDKFGNIHYCLARLPTAEKVKSFGKRALLELSPDSHDDEVAKASGRGHYTMQQMEDMLDQTIDHIYAAEVYYMVGLSKQDEMSVWNTLDYCEHLLKKYQGKRVHPYIAPMVPFLDPGSDCYDFPEEHGYKIIHKSLEDHRQALVSLNWRDRLNYETNWLSRQQLLDLSYDVVRSLYVLKNKYGQLPTTFFEPAMQMIDETRAMIDMIDGLEKMPEGPAKEIVAADIKKRVLKYNEEQLKGVRSQQRPADLGFSAKQQWFDTEEAIDRVLAA
ncbi:MAG: cobalamin-dependent protein [Deltaproteobacteria bacterium]|jgi:clorobiocin biosynthesis protein CloN6